MRLDDNARIPFSAIGVLLIILSTIIALYLLTMQSTGVTGALDNDREAGLNDALALAKADLDGSLNSACIFAQSEVGDAPLINQSSTCPYTGDVNMERIKDLTLRRLSKYLQENYDGNYAYGDYRINATAGDDYSAVTIEPVAMNLTRLQFSLTPFNSEYDTYYIVSVPIKMEVTKPGTAFNYSEVFTARTLVTSRYPLLENMTAEYEKRLNGTPMFVDMTAASFAYTWIRGYSQYAFGEPMNIVDDKDLALMANAGVLLEQGNEFNSVDPVALAALVKNTYEPDKSTKDVVNEDQFNDLNNYNFTNSSRSTLPNGTEAKAPEKYSFNIDEMVDAAYFDMINGSAYDVSGQQISPRGMVIQGKADAAYTCKMHVAIIRNSVEARYNDSGKELTSTVMFNPAGGIGCIAREIWRVHGRMLNGSWTDIVTVDYYVDEYADLGDTHNDVPQPYTQVSFDGFTDPDLSNAVASYKASTNMDAILVSRGNSGWSSGEKEVEVAYNHWVENDMVKTLERTSNEIKGDVGVTLNIDDYGSYQEMMKSAYVEMKGQFDRNLSAYRNDEKYYTGTVSQNVSGFYKSCGAKAIDYVLMLYLNDIESRLNYTASEAGENANKTVDDRMKDYTDMNSTDLNDNARSSKNLLENNKLYIPFGMTMKLASQPGSSGNYTWKEDVKLAVDQQPDFLSSAEYTDPETGYHTIPLKVRNVCMFTLPTDFLNTEQATGAVLDGIDAVSNTAYRMANDIVTRETTKVVHDITTGTRDRIKEEIKSALLSDVTMEGAVTEGDIDSEVDQAFGERSEEQVVSDLKNGTLQKEIAKKLADKARIEAAKKLDAYADQYAEYVETKTEAVVEEAEQKAIAHTIDACKEEIKSVFKGYMAEAAGHLEDEAVKEALKRIPSGLPLLPPWGWWATMNVWYIDIQGEIPVLTVYDVDNVPVPDPVLGHHATSYTRRWQEVYGPDDDFLGYNEPIKFQQRTCTFIVVPPGEQGIGDKIGGWDEKSEGFDST